MASNNSIQDYWTDSPIANSDHKTLIATLCIRGKINKTREIIYSKKFATQNLELIKKLKILTQQVIYEIQQQASYTIIKNH